MRVIVYGSSGYARTVSELAEDCGYEVVGWVDDLAPDQPGVIGRFDAILDRLSDCGVAMGIGYRDLSGRWDAWCRVRASGAATPSLVHPRAVVSRSAVVGPGTVIMAGAIVDQRARLGEAVVVWPGACINHDTEVGSNCFVSPNATICGEVRVGPNSFIGAGAAIADHCVLPAGSRVRMLERYAHNRKL